MYPAGSAERDSFILSRRPERKHHDPWRHQGVIVEHEPAADGRLQDVATIFLTGRECPWKCVMCDLWQYTTIADTPSGAIPVQIERALHDIYTGHAGTRAPSILKLYNAGSFFDPRAVPEGDYDAIVRALRSPSRVIVECHPALIGSRLDRFVNALASKACKDECATPTLEVAMGLETAHPTALEKLHKRFTLGVFEDACNELRMRGADLRVFLLVSPPFIPADEQDYWLARSIDFSIACGATAISLIPTRTGNGAMEALEADGEYRRPMLADAERSLVLAIETAGGHARVFLDMWNIENAAACLSCGPARVARLRQMNLIQAALPEVTCAFANEPHV
jgi:radical SAM enzyme (TIGR01210 family)